MLSLVLFLTALISTTTAVVQIVDVGEPESTSNYFVGNRLSTVNPLDINNSTQVFPIDVCIVHEVGAQGVTPLVYLGKYECLQNGSVAFHDFGLFNLQCAGEPVSTTVYEESRPAGELFSYSCGGEMNYLIRNGCAGPSFGGADRAQCCSPATNPCTPGAEATDVCILKDEGQTSYKVTCEGSTAQILYYDAPGCQEADLNTTESVDERTDVCLYNSVVIPGAVDLWTNLGLCVKNGTVTSEPPCQPTESPSMSPSAPSSSPSMSPSASPTAPTAAPTAAPAVPTIAGTSTATAMHVCVALLSAIAALSFV